jgi:hypothetical protein
MITPIRILYSAEFVRQKREKTVPQTWNLDGIFLPLFFINEPGTVHCAKGFDGKFLYRQYVAQGSAVGSL